MGKTKEKVNQKVEEIAGRLVELYAARNENIGFAFSKDDALQKNLKMHLSMRQHQIKSRQQKK